MLTYIVQHEINKKKKEPKKEILMKIFKAAKAGFTLIEMLIVVGILGILVSLATPAIYKSMSESKKTAMAANIKTLQDAEQRYQILMLSKGYGPENFEQNIPDLIQK